MLSRAIFFLCAAFMIYASLVFYPKWKQGGGEAAISYDASGYYWYLPAAFIYQDLKHQAFSDSMLKKYNPGPEFPGFRYANGNYVLKYSSGLALQELPFFAVANVLAKPFGYPQDGFSLPYQLAIQLGGLLVALIGIWYFRKLLLLFYNDPVTAIALFILVFCTNYIDFGAINIGMTHSWLFTLYVFLILNTIKFYKTFSYKYAAAVGLLVGLATLTRPTEVITCIIPLLWGMETIDPKAFIQRAVLLLGQWEKLLLALFCFGLFISIQLFYWKYVSGRWIVYSYEHQGFTWFPPHFRDYTFDWSSGWLIYTPVMFFAFVGVIPFIKKGTNKLPILLFMFLNYYIVVAWDVWTYGGRAMLQSYAILFFPLVSCIEVVYQNKILKWLGAIALLCFLYLNIWLTYHEHAGPEHLYNSGSDFNTRQYFMRSVGRWSIPLDYQKLRDNSEQSFNEPKNLHLIYQNDFENDTSIHSPLPAIEGKRSIYLDKTIQSSKEYKFTFNNKDHDDRVRLQATFFTNNKEWTSWKMTQFVVRFYNKNDNIKENLIRVQRFLDNGVKKDIYFDCKIPQKPYDTVAVVFWNSTSEQPIQVDNLKVWSYKE